MTSTAAATFVSPAIADCWVCKGTGIDEAFASPCNCRIGTSARVAALRADLGDNGRTAPQTGERTAPVGGGKTNPARFANQFPGRCTKCGTNVPAGAGFRVRDGQGWATRHNPGGCPQAVEVVAEVAQPAAARTNRYAAPCVRCSTQVPAGEGVLAKDGGAWVVSHATCPVVEAPAADGLDLTVLPVSDTQEAMWFGVPGMDTRLKLRVKRPTEGKWAGWVFVDDGAAYGYGTRYGKQAPGGRYVGQVQAELAAIIADPIAALAKYGALTDHCGVCSRPLEDETSVARGIGPKCWAKVNG
jgi:hypothetical protein